MTNKQRLLQYGFQDAIVYENPDFDDAIIGVDEVTNAVIYDYDLMVESLAKEDNISLQEAVQFIDYNTIRATPYMPQPRPIILKKIID